MYYMIKSKDQDLYLDVFLGYVVMIEEHVAVIYNTIECAKTAMEDAILFGISGEMEIVEVPVPPSESNKPIYVTYNLHEPGYNVVFTCDIVRYFKSGKTRKNHFAFKTRRVESGISALQYWNRLSKDFSYVNASYTVNLKDEDISDV